MGPVDPGPRRWRAGRRTRSRSTAARSSTPCARTPSASCPTRSRGSRGAAGVLVGSRHTAESLWEVCPTSPALPERTRLGPPGVDVHTLPAATADEPAAGLARLAAKLGHGAGGRLGRRARARPRRCAALDPRARPDRQLRGQADRLEGRRPAAGGLAARGGAGARRAARAWSGFGTYRDALEPLRGGAARAATSTSCARSPRAGRELEGGPPGELRYLRGLPRRAPSPRVARRRARPRPSGSTSPGGSSTTTCPTCCPPARRR